MEKPTSVSSVRRRVGGEWWIQTKHCRTSCYAVRSSDTTNPFKVITPATEKPMSRSGVHRQANGSSFEVKTLVLRIPVRCERRHPAPAITTATASSIRRSSVHRVRHGSSRERQPEHRSCNSERRVIDRYRTLSSLNFRASSRVSLEIDE